MATAKGNEAVLQATKLEQNLRQGCRVELTGLSSKDLNGQRGTISGSFNVDQKRWPLVVDGTGRKLSCKPANLRGLADVKNDAEYMWVALSTDYPTTYGCNHGRTYLPEELWSMSDTTAHKCTSERAALAKARELRNASEHFEHDGDGDGDSAFGAEPPYDSAVLENWDNDSEILIEVMPLAAYTDRVVRRGQAIEAKGKALQRAAESKEACTQAAIKAAGTVHYSWPPRKGVDVPAELEIDLSQGTFQGLDPALCAAVTTLLVDEGRRSGNGGHQATNDEFGALLAKFGALEELHWHNATASEERVEAVLAAAPQLCSRVKVLSMPWPRILDPDALRLLAAFAAVHTLSLRNGFSTEHYDHDYDCHDDEAEEVMPYDEPLQACLCAMESLKVLELGHGDPESQRYLFRYALSQELVEHLQACYFVKMLD